MYQLLVVDDEISSRNTLATCFPWEELGFKVCGQADHGKDALDFIEKNLVHVVFTDISMPVMDGIALARAVNEIKGQKPLIVFLSAYDDFQYAQKAIQYGVRYYVLKPSSFGELREVFGTIKKELDSKLTPCIPPREGGDDIINKVLEYCSQNYREGSLTELSQKLYLNPSYLSQLIKQKTDLTFSDYMTEIRMKQAALFLQNPDVKIYHISTMVGYVNPNNFTRAFKTYYGVTPSEYRSSAFKQQE